MNKFTNANLGTYSKRCQCCINTILNHVQNCKHQNSYFYITATNASKHFLQIFPDISSFKLKLVCDDTNLISNMNVNLHRIFMLIYCMGH